jgi:murein L,D-transpeptidase YafK
MFNRLTVVGIFLVSFSQFSFFRPIDFLSEQAKYERVRLAIKEKSNVLNARLKELGFTQNNINVLIIAYKSEDLLEIYAKCKSELRYKKFASYAICSKSGELGPKRKYGDNQVPEGFYYIDRFNPVSNYYLSLGINYPNAADKIKSKAANLGGDIFIHGECLTIGCLPMTNDKIKEIYLLAAMAKNSGQSQIPVYIFPFKMLESNLRNYSKEFGHNNGLIGFWENLKEGYDLFMNNQQPLNIKINTKGFYKF